MKLKEDLKTRIENELSKRKKRILNTNAISAFLNFFPALKALYDLFVGRKSAIEIEKTKITLDGIIEMIIAFDKRLSGIKKKDTSKVSILLEDIISKGAVTGIKSDTSSCEAKELLKKTIDVKLKRIQSQDKVTGIDLTVNKELKIEKPLNIETDIGSVRINPNNGDITFGKGTK